MMKYFWAAASLIALATTAADMAARTYKKAPKMAPAPIYHWTGYNIGGHVRLASIIFSDGRGLPLRNSDL